MGARLELRRSLIVAAPVLLGRSRGIGATNLRNAERDVAAFLPRNGVAEAFHQFVENLDFLCHACLNRDVGLEHPSLALAVQLFRDLRSGKI